MKKIISLFISLLMLCLSINLSFAEELSLEEYNGRIIENLGPIETPKVTLTDTVIGRIDPDNTVLEFDEIIEDSISDDCSQNEYLFELDESGSVMVNFFSESIEVISLCIYDEKGQEIWDDSEWADSTAEHISYSETVELTAGVYNFFVSEYSGYGDYELELSFETSNENFNEEQNGSNNTFKTADEIQIDSEYTGHLAENDKIDNYIFTLEQSGGIELTFIADGINGFTLTLYDEKGNEIWDDTIWWDSTSEHIAYEQYLALNSGIYYFTVSEYSGVGAYDFKLLFTSAEEDFEESQNENNNTFKTADEIECNTYYNGQIANNDNIDIYSFNVDVAETITIIFTANNMQGATLDIYDNKGKEIWSANSWWDSKTEEISSEETVDLEKGNYYISVSEYSGVGAYKFALITDDVNEENKSECSYCGEYFNIDDLEIDEYGDWICRNCYDEFSNEDDEITSFDSKVSEWAKDEVEEAYENDLIPETIIGEDLTEHITRAEFAAIAVQLYEELSGTYAPADENPFVDVDWNENIEYINKAYVLGITSGTSKTTFEPDIDITREQLATMLCRTIKKYSFDGWTLENDSDYYLDTSGVSRFADDNEISDYAKPSVYYMAKFGIINGVGDNKFAPRNITSYQEATGYATATREQAILMSLRIFNVSEIW